MGNYYGHLAGGAGQPMCHHIGIPFVADIPKGDACLGEKVENRHKGRSDIAKGVLDAVQLTDFDKGLFGRHLHVNSLQSCSS